MAITIKKETLKNGTASYKFVVNLGIPEGETGAQETSNTGGSGYLSCEKDTRQ